MMMMMIGLGLAFGVGVSMTGVFNFRSGWGWRYRVGIMSATLFFRGWVWDRGQTPGPVWQMRPTLFVPAAGPVWSTARKFNNVPSLRRAPFLSQKRVTWRAGFAEQDRPLYICHPRQRRPSPRHAARSVEMHYSTRAFQFGQKKISIRFDSIRQSDNFAACTLIFK